LTPTAKGIILRPEARDDRSDVAKRTLMDFSRRDLLTLSGLAFTGAVLAPSRGRA
jgi:hypothetical protein